MGGIFDTVKRECEDLPINCIHQKDKNEELTNRCQREKERERINDMSTNFYRHGDESLLILDQSLPVFFVNLSFLSLPTNDFLVKRLTCLLLSRGRKSASVL